MAAPTNQPMANVGLSLTLGRSTKYAAEKIEVSAWCTLPCLPDEESIKETYQVAYDFVESEAGARANQALAKYFPELLTEDDS